MDEKKTVIIDLKFDVSDFTQSAAKLNKEIATINKQQTELKKQGQEGSIQYQKNSEALRENRKELAEVNKTISNLTTANKANAGSNEQLKAQLSIMTLEYNKLSEEQRKNSARGKELFTQINQTTATLKENEKAVGDNRREVGNYALILSELKAELKAAKGEALAMGQQYGVASKEFQEASLKAGLLADKIKETNEATKVFTTGSKFEQFGNSLKGVGSDLSSLDFEGASEKANQLLAISKSMTFKEAISGATSFGTTVKAVGASLLTNPVFLLAAALIAVGLAAKQMYDSIAAGDSILKENAESLKEITKETDLLIQKNQELAIKEKVATKEITKESGEAQLIRLKQRQDFNNAHKELLDQQAKDEKELNEKINEEKSIFGIGNRKLEEVRQQGLAEIRAKYDEQERVLIANSVKEKKLAENEIVENTKESEKEKSNIRKEKIKEAVDEQKKLIDLFILEQGVRAKGLDEELKIAEQVSAKKIAILEQERKKKLITETDYKIQSLQITQELEVKKAQILLAAAERELKMFTDANQSKLDANQFLNDTMYQQEIDRLEAVNNAQKKYAAKQLELGLISQQEYNDKINELNTANQTQVETLAKDKKAADDAKKAEDLALQYEIDLQRNEDAFNLQVAELERRREAEILAADKTGADKKLIDEKYDGFKRQLELKQAQTTIGVAADTFGALASLAGDNAEAAKAFASFQAIMNATNSIISVLAATSTIPEPFGSVAKGIQATAIGVTAFRNVQKINSTPVPKAARGYMGVFGGRSHSAGGTQGYFSDGTQIEVEKDELFAVVNKRNTSMLRYLNDLNTFGGNGNSFFAKGGVKSFANGGIGLSNVSTSVEQSQNSVEQLLLAVQSLPNPVVAVQDINYVQSDVNRVQARANL